MPWPFQPTKAPHLKKVAHDLDLRTMPERALLCFHVIYPSFFNVPRVAETSSANIHPALGAARLASFRHTLKSFSVKSGNSWFQKAFLLIYAKSISKHADMAEQ